MPTTSADGATRSSRCDESPTQRVTVVIPCYNQGEYLEDSVGSALVQSYPAVDVVVVDDGSDQPDTLRILADFEKSALPRVTVVRSTNQGLAAARNRGISQAQSEFILPLDADDKIGPDYVKEAVSKLNAEPEVGIVYCKAEFFGDQEGLWRLPPFSPQELLCNNIIFCSSLFRKSHWESLGGYCVELKHGWEDWDLWLGFLELGLTAHQLDGTHFFYRVRGGSMIRTMTAEQEADARRTIVRRHEKLYANVPMQGDTPALSRLFAQEDGSYPHDHMARQQLPKENIALFQFLRPIRTRMFKLVLPEGACCLRIESASVLDSSGTGHPLALHRTNGTPMVDGSVCFSDTPILFFRPPIELDASEVSVETRCFANNESKAPTHFRTSVLWLFRGLRSWITS